MSRLLALSTFLQAANEGLTWSGLIADLPTDPVSVFALLLLIVSVGMVIWFGRPGGKGGRRPA
jgi:hypothetical protein